MNAEIKAEWVKRLRDGRPQTTGCLHRTSSDTDASAGQCCLGVLCEIAAERGIIESKPQLGRIAYGKGVYFQTGTLPMAVKLWAGLTSAWGNKLMIDGELKDMSGHNDDGATFPEIATAIEAQL